MPSDKTCPACGHEQDASLPECARCGIIFAKWKDRETREEYRRRAPGAGLAGRSPAKQAWTLACLVLLAGGMTHYRSSKARASAVASFAEQSAWTADRPGAAAPTGKPGGLDATFASWSRRFDSVLGKGGAYTKLYNETSAKALLKEYAVMQGVYRMEERDARWRYGSVKDLFGDGGSKSLISERLYRAWDGHPSPRAANGYLFAEIDTGADGLPLDRTKRAGLCAYPERPGRSGEKVILMLLDDDRRYGLPHGVESPDVGQGRDWNYYVAEYAKAGKPARVWPTPRELSDVFRVQAQYAPGQAVTAARGEIEQASKDAGAPLVPPEDLRKAEKRAEPALNAGDARAKLHAVRAALYLYFEDTGRVPTRTEGLSALTAGAAPYLKPSDAVDAWGRPFNFRLETVPKGVMEEHSIYVYSSGPDGLPDTPDDVHLR
jgi:hypothetical protein